MMDIVLNVCDDLFFDKLYANLLPLPVVASTLNATSSSSSGTFADPLVGGLARNAIIPSAAAGILSSVSASLRDVLLGTASVQGAGSGPQQYSYETSAWARDDWRRQTLSVRLFLFFYSSFATRPFFFCDDCG
jgi:hypothetical protein